MKKYRSSAALFVALAVLLIAPLAQANETYEFFRDGSNEVLARLKFSTLPATINEIVSFSITAEGSDFLFFQEGEYPGTFDTPNSAVVDDGMNGLSGSAAFIDFIDVPQQTGFGSPLQSMSVEFESGAGNDFFSFTFEGFFPDGPFSESVTGDWIRVVPEPTTTALSFISMLCAVSFRQKTHRSPATVATKFFHKKSLLLVALIALFGGIPVSNLDASSIPVINAGFEDPVLPNGRFSRRVSNNNPNAIVTPDPLPGWSVPGSSGGAHNPTTAQFPGEAPEGENYAYNGGSVTFSQILSHRILPNTRYELSVEVGNRVDTRYSGFGIQLLGDGNVLADSGVNPFVPSLGTFQLATTSFETGTNDAAIGQPLEIQLFGGGGSGQVAFDDVKVTSTALVPEPSSVALSVIAFSICVLRFRKRF